MRWVLNALYAGMLALAAPVWLWKAPQARRYRAGLKERLGLAPRMTTGGRRLWVHCASVGEASIPRDLVARFREAHPDWEIVFSTFTDTGADRLRDLYPGSPVFFWPLDLSFCAGACLNRVRPDAVVLVELEIWPNFLLGCLDRKIPVVVVSGRINEASVRLLRGVGRLLPGMWEAVRLCCARSQVDAERFARAGLPSDRIRMTGSLKYDSLPLEADEGKARQLRRKLGIAEGAPVLVAGSTHPGEDKVLCGVYKRLSLRHRGLRLILVPRHIERAAALADSLEARGLTVVRKTDLDAGRRTPAGNEVILVDTIGDLVTCYALATCAFVGRSLLPPGGGQNMMEPAALGKPVVVGPHTGNFRPEMQLLRAAAAIVEAPDEAALASELDRLLSDPRAARRLGERARRTVSVSRGATARTLDELERVLPCRRSAGERRRP